MKKLLFIILGTALLSCSQPTENNTTTQMNQSEQTKGKEESIYALEYQTPSGEKKSMQQYKGQVILIVNTATQCGLTPQFTGLENLHTTYAKKGLKVLGFPCNQFGGQEPLADKDMIETCKINHGVTFELTKKIEVNGENQDGIYQFLKSKQPLAEGNDIRWNFEKFLINREGEIINRFSPKTTPEEITLQIENIL